jgi:hypothetical protein
MTSNNKVEKQKTEIDVSNEIYDAVYKAVFDKVFDNIRNADYSKQFDEKFDKVYKSESKKLVNDPDCPYDEICDAAISRAESEANSFIRLYSIECADKQAHKAAKTAAHKAVKVYWNSIHMNAPGEKVG